MEAPTQDVHCLPDLSYQIENPQRLETKRLNASSVLKRRCPIPPCLTTTSLAGITQSLKPRLLIVADPPLSSGMRPLPESRNRTPFPR